MLKEQMNYQLYDELGEGWYSATDHPIAFLRAESRFRFEWVKQILKLRNAPLKILDAGCGAGFLCTALAAEGYNVTGVDQSKESLAIAQHKSPNVKYFPADLYALPFAAETFDVVCCMDVLEHLDDVEKFVGEVSRILKQGGYFIFYTFNRTWLSKLLVIRAIEFLFPETGKNIHLYDLFIKPRELEEKLYKNGLTVAHWQGVRPVIFQKEMWHLLKNREVMDTFRFQFTPSLNVGYLGYAVKQTTLRDVDFSPKR